MNLARLGLHVFPTAAADPKRPLTVHGYKDATTDADVIASLWGRFPSANLAVATGRASGVFVLDVDEKGAGGHATLRALEARNGPLPATWTTATPSGGRHLWFASPTDRSLRNRVCAAPGLDVRTDGGSVVAPPSRRRDGMAYRWLRDPFAGPPAGAPSWLLALIDPPPVVRPPTPPLRLASLDRAARYAASAINRECGEIGATMSGGRNARLFQGAARIGELVGAGLVSLDLAERELELAAVECGLVRDDGRHAALASIKSGLARGAQNPRGVRL